MLSSIGFGMESVALGWLIYDMTDSAFMVGVSAGIRMLPLFVLGLISGFIADNVQRRVLLRIVTFSSALVMLALGCFLFLSIANVGIILLFSMLSGGCFAFILTLRQTYAQDIVGAKSALSALSVLQISSQGGSILGALFSGILIEYLGIDMQYIAIGIMYLLAFIAHLKLTINGASAPTEYIGFTKTLLSYFTLVKMYPILLLLMLLTALTEIFGFTYMTLIPIYAKEILIVGAFQLGLLIAIRQLGGVFGLIFLSSLDFFRRKGLLLIALTYFFGLTQMTAYFSKTFITYAIALFLINACAMTVDTLYKTLIQNSVPNKDRGTAIGSWVLSIGSAPIGHISIGSIASKWGAPLAMSFNGIVLAGTALISIIWLKKIRDLKL